MCQLQCSSLWGIPRPSWPKNQWWLTIHFRRRLHLHQEKLCSCLRNTSLASWFSGTEGSSSWYINHIHGRITNGSYVLKVQNITQKRLIRDKLICSLQIDTMWKAQESQKMEGMILVQCADVCQTSGSSRSQVTGLLNDTKGTRRKMTIITQLD